MRYLLIFNALTMTKYGSTLYSSLSSSSFPGKSLLFTVIQFVSLPLTSMVIAVAPLASWSGVSPSTLRKVQYLLKFRWTRLFWTIIIIWFSGEVSPPLRHRYPCQYHCRNSNRLNQSKCKQPCDRKQQHGVNCGDRPTLTNMTISGDIPRRLVWWIWTLLTTVTGEWQFPGRPTDVEGWRGRFLSSLIHSSKSRVCCTFVLEWH